MPTYVVLTNYTQQGMAGIKESPARVEAFKAFAKSMGAELKAWYLLMGRYDGLLIFEAPDDKTIATMLLVGGMQGNVTTETFRAFDTDEMNEVIAALPG